MIKPTVIFILVITIAGHLFCNRTYFTLTDYKKSQGYHTFLLAASWGLGLFCVSFIITSISGLSSWGKLFGSWFKLFLEILLPNIGDSPSEVNLLAVYLITLFLSYIIPKGIKIGVPRDRLFETWKLAAKKDSTPEFSSIMFSSWEKGLPIAFTLSNNKVYIGYVVETGVDNNDMNILPLVSGYRSDETKDLIYLIDYKPVIEKIQKHKGADISQFLISIPHREIIHANLHNFDYKQHFDVARYDIALTEPDETNFTVNDDQLI